MVINNWYLYWEKKNHLTFTLQYVPKVEKYTSKCFHFLSLRTSKRNNFLSFSAIRCLKTGLCLRS